MIRFNLVSGFCTTFLLFSAVSALAADIATKVAARPPAAHSDPFQLSKSGELILSAAPREEADEADAIFGPVAEFLSREIKRPVVFRHAGNWGIYQGMMQKGAYDLAFDGPHFNAWRMERGQHNILVKVPGDHVFVVIVKNDNARIRDIKQLAGRSICAHAPPNLGTLTALNEFENPSRQPVIVNTDGWKNIYQGLLANKCQAAALPLRALEKFEKETGRQSRIVFRGATLPDNALSAGPRVPTSVQEQITQALLSPEGEKVTARLREKYGQGRKFVAANNKEFAGLSNYLKNEWGY